MAGYRIFLFALGIALLLLAFASPIAAIGEEELFSFHMLQHVMIGDLAPLCLLAGLSGPMLRPLLAFRTVERLRVLANPVVALPIWATNLYLWHLPFLYEAAVRHSSVHALEHACFFTAGLIMWLPVLETLPAPEWFGTGPKLAYIACVRVVETVLGNVFVWSGTVFYGVYARGDELWGVSPLQDQGLAGAVMMIEGSIVTIVALAWLFLRLAQEGEVRQELLERGLDPARGAAGRPLRPGAGAGRPALNSNLQCVRAASITSTWSSRRSSAACRSTASCWRRSAITGSERSRASAARRSGTSPDRAARSGSARHRQSRMQRIGGVDRYQRRAAPPGARGGLALGRRRAPRLARLDGRDDRVTAERVQLHPRLLRGLLLRPGRDQARDRPRAGVGRVGLLEGDGRRRPLDLQLCNRAQAVGAARVERRDGRSAAAPRRRRPTTTDPHRRGVSRSAYVNDRQRTGRIRPPKV